MEGTQPPPSSPFFRPNSPLPENVHRVILAPSQPEQTETAIVTKDESGNLVMCSDTDMAFARATREFGIPCMSIRANAEGEVFISQGETTTTSKKKKKKKLPTPPPPPPQEQTKLEKRFQVASLSLTPEGREHLYAYLQDPTAVQDDKGLLVVQAIKAGDFETVKKLASSLNHYRDPVEPRLQQYAQHTACFYDRSEILRWLLETEGLDVNVRSFSGKQCIHYAMSSFSAECVRVLVEHGKSDLRAPTANGDRPIDCLLPVKSFDASNLRKIWEEVLDEEKRKRMITCMRFMPLDQLQHLPQYIIGGEENVVVGIEEEEEEDDRKCMICMDRMANTLVKPCLHVVVCQECSKNLKRTADAHRCVRCRCAVTSVENI